MEMETWYKTSNYGKPITTVEVTKETETSIWVKGSRVNKISTYTGYFRTVDEAKVYLISCADKEIERAEGQLKYYYNKKKDLLDRINEHEV